MAFNSIIMIGRLTADPELKVTPSGTNVCSFSIAVDRPRKNGEEAVADFFNVVAWRGTAEFVSKYFAKGMAILVRGRLQNRSWTDNNGNKRYATDIIAEEVAFVEKKAEQADAGNKQANAPTYKAPAAANGVGSFEDLSSDDELPF